VAEYLIAEQYTSPTHLAIMGASAGAILVGRAITERPDLFAVALPSVGVLDMLRLETTSNGVPNIAEFGSVKTEEGFKALHAMSAYHHVLDGTRYPAVLLQVGRNDPRVEPWQSAKMAARLQAATTSGKPVLFSMDDDAGHGGLASTRNQRQGNMADAMAFALWQFGAPKFQQACRADCSRPPANPELHGDSGGGFSPSPAYRMKFKTSGSGPRIGISNKFAGRG
jgi:prolyl oligopeptidase